MDENSALAELFNPEYDLSFGGKTYHVKKANLRKAFSYQKKIKDISTSESASPDLELIAYCLFLILSEVDSTITPEYVLDNTPADIDVVGTLQLLGFMSPQKVQKATNS